VVLLEWTEPVAARWPDVKAGLSALTFGHPDHRLATIVAGQRRMLDWYVAHRVNPGRVALGGLDRVPDPETTRQIADLSPIFGGRAA
jgi:hypothetical protein